MADRFRLVFSPRFSSDLHAIFGYIQRDSPQNAAGMVRKIIDAVDSLELFPERHPIAQDVRNPRGETRVMHVRPYLIFYRILDKQQAVRLITVRHGARRRPHRIE